MSAKKKQKVDAKAAIVVAMPGDQGSFSANAAKSYFSGSTVELQGAKSFKDVFRMVSDGTAQYGVVPMESSMSGSMQNTHDLLIQYQAYIVGEIARTEKHCLVAHKGIKLEQISKVFSHPHLLMQCSVFLDDLEGKTKTLERICTADSIAGCKLVKASAKEDAAAGIASEEAAQIYGLEIVSRDISNYSPMETRYIVISKERKLMTNPLRAAKQSICASIGNEPGSLARVVSCFAHRNINIVRLEPRPSSTALDMNTGKSLKHWDYVYHIDFEPSKSEETNKRLLENLKEFCVVVRDFGTYPSDVKKTEISHDTLMMSPMGKTRDNGWSTNLSIFI